MDKVISEIHTLSTRNDSDLKKLKDFLRHEFENLKASAASIDQALLHLDLQQHTLGVAFLLAAQLSAAVFADQSATFAYIGNFLKSADELQVKKASVPVNSVCKSYAQMAIDLGQQAMLQSLQPLLGALEKMVPNAETLVPVHTEFLRVCLKAKAYHFASRVLDRPIYDIALSSSNCTQMTSQSFLCYFYYGAMIRIGLKEYRNALQMLLVVLTCPGSCLSAIQADAYKKYVLVSLKVNGDVAPLPVYVSHIIQRFAKCPSYVLDLHEAFKKGDAAALKRSAEEKAPQIQADGNTGLVNQVIAALWRHKVHRLTKTYLTLSLLEIAEEVGVDPSQVEALLVDMVSSREINARIDQSTGNVIFEDEEDEMMDVGTMAKLQEKLQRVMELAQRISAFEHEVVSSEAYIRRTAALETGPAAAASAFGVEM